MIYGQHRTYNIGQVFVPKQRAYNPQRTCGALTIVLRRQTHFDLSGSVLSIIESHCTARNQRNACPHGHICCPRRPPNSLDPESIAALLYVDIHSCTTPWTRWQPQHGTHCTAYGDLSPCESHPSYTHGRPLTWMRDARSSSAEPLISSPMQSQYMTAPNDQMSLSLLYGCPSRISGAIYAGVPVKVEAVPTRIRLTPKSMSCTHTTTEPGWCSGNRQCSSDAGNGDATVQRILNPCAPVPLT